MDVEVIEALEIKKGKYHYDIHPFHIHILLELIVCITIEFCINRLHLQ